MVPSRKQYEPSLTIMPEGKHFMVKEAFDCTGGSSKALRGDSRETTQTANAVAGGQSSKTQHHAMTVKQDPYILPMLYLRI
ncbi:hypothetical protein MYU51_010597 [Penicillium brevicompactum]